MKFAIFITLCCLGLVSSKVVAKVTGGVVKKPTSQEEIRCCMPETWQGYVSSTALPLGEQFPYNELLEVATKGADQEVAFYARDRYTYQEQYRMIVKYAEGILYYITNEGQNCVVTAPIEEFPSQCLPEAALFYGRYFQGTPDAGLPATFWRENNNNKDEVFGFSLEGCVPLFTEATWLDNHTTYRLREFANITSSIRNPEMFDIPESCNNPPKTTKKFRIPDIGI